MEKLNKIERKQKNKINCYEEIAKNELRFSRIKKYYKEVLEKLNFGII